MTQSNRPSYSRGPVRTLATLAETVGLTEPQLRALANNANTMYRAAPQVKKDGSVRETWDAYPQLKEVHAKLNVRFLKQVSYPMYLQGGIRDRASPRDYVRHVNFHAGSKCVIALDIQDFFPSITEKMVVDIWRNFFRFSEQVADMLATLTTKNGVLVQGARTSNYLANLVFWRNERWLVEQLAAQGWTYSRLTDDITLSKRTIATSMEVAEVLAFTVNFLRSHSFQLKRSKLRVHRTWHRMELNGLVANVRPSLSKTERARIRAEVTNLANAIHTPPRCELSPAPSTLGRLGKLKRFHPREAASLTQKLHDSLNASAIEAAQ
jgi:hypothetical protein